MKTLLVVLVTMLSVSFLQAEEIITKEPDGSVSFKQTKSPDEILDEIENLKSEVAIHDQNIEDEQKKREIAIARIIKLEDAIK